MKRLHLLFIGLLMAVNINITYAQKLSVGFHSGINLSDIHGNHPSGKWKFKPGPSQALSLDYALTGSLGVRTGLNYSTVYYEHHPYFNYDIIPLAGSLSSSYSSTSIWYYPTKEMMNFSFLTFPLQLRLTIPSKPELSLALGAYYSITLENSFHYLYSEEQKAENDLGFTYSASLAYPLGDRLKAHLNLGYISGRRGLLEYSEWKHGRAELSLGLSYDIIPLNKERDRIIEKDSISDTVFLTYRAGGGISWNSGSSFTEKYKPLPGFSAGIDIGFKLSSSVNFRTGLSFDRIGFTLNDSSDVYYRYYVSGDANYYVDTRVSTDYIVIPALLEFHAGRKVSYYLNTGPYLGVRLNARCSGKAISRTSNEGSYTTSETIVYDDITGLIRNNDFGWMTGIGAAVPLYGNTMLDISLRHRYGFTEVFDRSELGGQDTGYDNETIMRNSSVFLNIGLRVPVFKISR